LFVIVDKTFRELFETSDPVGVAMLNAEISELPEIDIKGNPENAERFVDITVTETLRTKEKIDAVEDQGRNGVAGSNVPELQSGSDDRGEGGSVTGE